MLERGTWRRSSGRWGARCFVVPASKRAMKALASVAIDFGGTMRSARQASTAASSSSPVFDGWPARASSSTRRRRFSCGREGSGGRPVAAITQRSYDTGSPRPRISIERSHIADRQRPSPSKYAPRSPPSARPSDARPSIAPFTWTAARKASIAARSGSFAATPPLCRSFDAVACVYASGSGSSENQESTTARPVPEGFITSPPQSVSMPSRASAVRRPSRSIRPASPSSWRRTRGRRRARRSPPSSRAATPGRCRRTAA